MTITGYGQISPGDLTQAHAHLEGMSNCTQCHDIGSKVSNTKCLDCHKEIKSLVSSNKGYHAHRTVKSKDCFDCHSDVTKYPWYNNITPVNYWLADHVEEGKHELNFSKWSSYSTKRKDHKLEETIEMIENHEMPLESYTWVHKEAVLTEADILAVKDWVDRVRLGYALESSPQ